MLRIKPATDAFQKAGGLFSKGDYEGAAGSATRAIALSKSLKAWSIERESQRLLGEIRVSQGRYREALTLLPIDWRKNVPPYTDVNVALAFLKIGDLVHAHQFFHPDAFYNKGGPRADDLPSVATAKGLEARIRYARGMNYFLRGRELLALREFQIADRLAPDNGLIDYYAGMSLVHMGKMQEAKPYFRATAARATGWMQADAKKRI